uniref:N-acetyltransferase domain-containing protein n=1 Tax=Globisporangium ultimum (strain ATCC 200006 / CBS 805.95 / DAOM BR144) TaxID=431595 RepID=K3XC88_GLOUD
MLAPVVLGGIAAGATVFVATIVAVFFLLQHGGSFERMRHEATGLPTTGDDLKPLLYDELLVKARAMALQPAPLGAAAPLKGECVRIRDFKGEKEDFAALFRISNGEPREGIYREIKYDADDMIWKFLDVGPFDTQQQLKVHLTQQQSDSRHFVLVEPESSAPIGMITLSAHAPRDLRVQIDSLWLTPAFQGGPVATETVLLLLTHLFESVGYRRVEWRCDGHNVRARRAAHSLGFSFEGVLRKHRIVKDCNCDSVMFAAINSEWPMTKEHLERKLHARKQTVDATDTAEDKKKTR